ncbi:MAG: hypothetical protein K9L98_01990 [Candidatus Pacebacteria bacterium]|nr:hypothetical protein [Candidatus Paceibacterota bacterium]MCF7862758.1 hypothetical protein [Candidatus Paceibacterota bacterium]
MIKNKTKKIHLIGICGKGMSALAILLKEKGFRVTGTDEGFYEPILGLLKKNNIKFNTKYSAENIPEDADTIIIGNHAGLNKNTNEEVAKAFSSGIPIQSLPEGLALLANKTENTIVVGSFGKSTTSALLAWCLEKSKKNPSYFIGAMPLGMKKNAHLSKSRHFIFEGDEYPSAGWDPRAKFLHLNPTNAIFTSAEHDHINVFPTEKDYIKPYQKFISLLPAKGLLIYSKNGKNVASITSKTKSKKVDYGISKDSTWHPENIKYGEKTTFDLYKNNKKIINLSTKMLGMHNIENIIGVSAFLLEKKLLSPTELQKSIASFKGISGRLDLKSDKTSVQIYEGFGSSYSKAQSVFSALKLHFPNKKLITIFEPHTFSWRNKQASAWYKDIFETSEVVIVLPPPTHGATTHQQMSFQEIVTEIKKYKKEVYAGKNEKEVLSVLNKIVKKDDIIALISSGPLLGLTKSVPNLMETKFPKK